MRFNDVVDHPDQRFQVWGVDLLVFAGDVEGCDSEALELFFGQVVKAGQVLVNNTDGHEKCLRPHLELVVKLDKPVDQVCSHFLIYVRLVLQESGR